MGTTLQLDAPMTKGSHICLEASTQRSEIGSRSYFKHMTNEEVSNTAAMVNMDTPGLAPQNCGQLS